MCVKSKLKQIRQLMKENKIDTYIITKFDPHQSEYTTPHYDTVKFISDFTGSNGTVVITDTVAGLWTDGRYFIQAEKQLDKDVFTLFKTGLPNSISFLDFAYKNTQENGTIGILGETISTSDIKKLTAKIYIKNIELNIGVDFISKIWDDRPKRKNNKVFIHEEKFAGKSRVEKISEVQRELEEKNCDLTIINILEDIAWLYNLRGYDGNNTPTFNSYTIITKKTAILFIDKFKLSDVITDLTNDNIKIFDYHEIFAYLSKLDKSKKVYIKESTLNYKLYKSIEHTTILNGNSNITELLKARKNPIEINNIETAYTRDCVALLKTIKYIKENVHSKTITELDVDRMLIKNRSMQNNYLMPSFDTIAGYNGNGAMLHYRATKNNHAIIKPSGFLLIDSGAQYLDGTTDITRTISLGDLTDEMKKDFTLTLKSMMAVSRARFLEDTPGICLDMLARQPMWNNGLDYKSGTGHGLGYCLNVHEGPQGISPRSRDIGLQLGMVVTNEPGVYKLDKYGIRTENTLVVVDDLKTDIDTFYKFKTLTFFPIDVDAIDKSLLSEDEINWINNYHKDTYNKLSPFLTLEEKTWLQKETREI